MDWSRFWAMARRPRWIGALLLALAVAAAFAALGQWQLERSVEAVPQPASVTETPLPLDEVAQPQHPVLEPAIGQRVRFEAQFVPADFTVLSKRINHDDPGYWVVGHAIVDGGPSLAVALGWAPTENIAWSAIEVLRANPPSGTFTGRHLPSEAPPQSDFEAGERSALAVPELINVWSQQPDGVYGGYVIWDDAAPGLEPIDAPPPPGEVSLNLLNIFYAIEWVVFGGFAIFLWYRLVRDAVEAEVEGAAEEPAGP